MNKDEIFFTAQKVMRYITNSFGKFMDIKRVVVFYLWPFVFCFIAILLLVGIDSWLH